MTKAQKISESVSYRVWIVGVTWEGFTSTYDYGFDHEPTVQEIRQRAGDFNSIADYETVRITAIQYSDGDRRIVKVVKPWDSQESADISCRANGC